MELDDDDVSVDEPALPDPGAGRRYRFKHPTASGKTIAAAGFVEAGRTTGVLILTHRRLLVNQFTRDLTHEGYGHRLHEPVLIGQPTPRIPPLTINTYAWFIKHADQIKRDVYGVVVCDEAHTALGEKTAAAIRRFSEPVYIGMTATDQLLQKHVGDVFPAEVADFPLAEAVRRGVVAPLRCVRVKPIASLRQVDIVGGDFDQGQLAAALDIDPLNLAAADLYQSRFGDTPGIVYAAGVDHAERVAAAMRAIGLAAAAVSGRTPPRELAETLAAYERGETNVLVNAQILAEGWNAPRATVCMHLAPTASRRVYQQRVGRIMRLHRRKEAGVVVDFAEVGAPHSERVVTLHSLLDVDAYRPGGLVTPPPPRRRRGRRKPARPIVKEANWIVPVSDDPERRVGVIASQWKHVDASKLPLDEQRAWATVAARQLAPGDVHTLTERIVALQPEARELFFFTCAAENKHRKLRLSSLGDLAAAAQPDDLRHGLPPRRGCADMAAGPRSGRPRAAPGDGRREDRGAARPDRRVDMAACARRPRPRVPLRREPYPGRPEPPRRPGRREVRRRAQRGLPAARRDRTRRAARGGRRAPGSCRAAARHAGRAADRVRPAHAVGGADPAGGRPRLQHPGPGAALQAGAKDQAQGREGGRDRVVQRRGRRLDASGDPGEARRRRRRGRGDAGGRGAAARRRGRGARRAGRARASLAALGRRRADVRDRGRGARGGGRDRTAGRRRSQASE